MSGLIALEHKDHPLILPPNVHNSVVREFEALQVPRASRTMFRWNGQSNVFGTGISFGNPEHLFQYKLSFSL